MSRKEKYNKKKANGAESKEVPNWPIQEKKRGVQGNLRKQTHLIQRTGGGEDRGVAGDVNPPE